jgi:hypothetical protein
LFQNSPLSKRLFDYGNRKFGSTLAWIFLLKCCAIVSSQLDRPRLSVIHVAPTRQGKSFTSNEVMKVFAEEFWLDLRSDFTINSLNRYRGELESGKCLLVNDATTLFASKSQRTKDRLVGGLSELLSDECYTYQDFGYRFTLRGKVTMIVNITSEAYQNYKNRLFGLTFSERFLTVHHAFSQQDKTEWVARLQISKGMHFGKLIRIDDISTRVEIGSDYLSIVPHIAQQFSFDSLTSPVACQDLINAAMCSHASLNKRHDLCIDDLVFVKRIQPFLVNLFSPYEGKIVRFRAKGLGIEQICKAIHKGNYGQQVQRVIKKAELRGILSPSESHPE